jgi:hypothetical protein
MPKNKRSIGQSAWFLQVVLPTVLIAMLVLWLVLWLRRRYCLAVSGVTSVPVFYQLEGDPAWVAGRTWSARDPDSDKLLAQSDVKGQLLITDAPSEMVFALAHPDWQVSFLLMAKPERQCRFLTTASLDELTACAKQYPRTINLNHELDEVLGRWREAILLRDWETLAPMTTLPGGETRVLNELLDSWVNDLLAEGYTPISLDLYLDWEKSTTSEARGLLFWHLEKTTGQTLLQQTEITLEAGADDVWHWRYATSDLPRF